MTFAESRSSRLLFLSVAEKIVIYYSFELSGRVGSEAQMLAASIIGFHCERKQETISRQNE